MLILIYAALINPQMNFYGSDLKLLSEAFGKENLPKELGGDLPHGDDLAKVSQISPEFSMHAFCVTIYRSGRRRWSPKQPCLKNLQNTKLKLCMRLLTRKVVKMLNS